MTERKTNGVLIIPAYNPTEKFVEFAVKAAEYFYDIIVINDGSKTECDSVFTKIEATLGARVHLLCHEQNQGKGVALKTAFSYFQRSGLADEYVGVITADCDGQHELHDIVMLDEKLGEVHTRCMHIGHRDLNSKIMPFRSKFGNKLTAACFSALYGVKMKDTQTGLRAFSADIIDWLLEIKGNRFEYEMNMLVHSRDGGIHLYEHPITTKYEEKHTSHYSTFRDSFKVARVLFAPLVKYIFAALLAFGVDMGLYALFADVVVPYLGLTETAVVILLATVGARVLSSVVNFLTNRFFTFGGKRISKNSIWKYYLLWALQMAASYGAVLGLTLLVGGGDTWWKMGVDLLLAITSYQVQMRWVFKRKKMKGEE